MPRYSHEKISAWKALLLKRVEDAREKVWRKSWLQEDRRHALMDLADAVEIILADWSQAISEREDITGLSTSGKNKNAGNSGFAGGCTQPAGNAT